MTPEDLTAVERSWAELRQRGEALVEVLAGLYETGPPSPVPAQVRAEWLVAAVMDLAGLLHVPSRLASRARELGATWPDPLVAPSFAVEGRAWMAAADACLPAWSETTEAAWRAAWLLLSDVLAAEALSPFADGPPPPPTDGTSEEGAVRPFPGSQSTTDQGRFP